MSWGSRNHERTAETAAAECRAAQCDGDTHYSGQKHPETNEDIEVGPCPNWKAAAA